MPNEEYSDLVTLIGRLQDDVSELRVQVARLEARCGWCASILGLLGGAVPVAITLMIRFLWPGK